MLFRSELLGLAAAIEARSEHPLARAICEYAAGQAGAESSGKTLGQPASKSGGQASGVQMHAPSITGYTQIAGGGISCQMDGIEALAGNAHLMGDRGVLLGECDKQAEALAAKGATPLFFSRGGMMQGIVALSDVPKPDSADALVELHAMGIASVMLTGDNRRTAEAIQRQVGADSVIADVLPADKEREVRLLEQSGAVAMVGDGINDAPALARADVGIAVGAGTDVAMESADAVLMRSDLMDVVAMIQLSRATMRNIHQNLFWALFYNAACIPIAAGVLAGIGVVLNPMIAAAAMSLSSICVVSNALRLRAWKPRFVTAASTTGQGSDDATGAAVQGIESGTGTAVQGSDTELVSSSLPSVGSSIQDDQKEAGMNKMLNVEGMMCEHCVAHVKQALEAVDGVTGAEVDLDAKQATVGLSADVSDETLIAAVDDAGYEASVK